MKIVESELKSLQMDSLLAISVSPSILKYGNYFFREASSVIINSNKSSIYLDIENIRTLCFSSFNLVSKVNKTSVFFELFISSLDYFFSYN